MRAFWQHVRCSFESFVLDRWRGLYEAIVEGRTRNQPIGNTS